MIEIVVNGKAQQVPDAQSVAELLVWLKVDPGRVAVERNRQIVRKPEWASTTVGAGDQFEIVWFVGGG